MNEEAGSRDLSQYCKSLSTEQSRHTVDSQWSACSSLAVVLPRSLYCLAMLEETRWKPTPPESALTGTRCFPPTDELTWGVRAGIDSPSSMIDIFGK